MGIELNNRNERVEERKINWRKHIRASEKGIRKMLAGPGWDVIDKINNLMTKQKGMSNLCTVEG